MRTAFPYIRSLYGRIFAIFWFTMLLVLLAVLTLPHLDPREVRSISPGYLNQLDQLTQRLVKQSNKEDNLGRLIFKLDDQSNSQKGRPQYFLTDLEDNILTSRKANDSRIRILQHFISSSNGLSEPKQKLYGRHMLAGPLPVTLAEQKLNLYISTKWDRPSPILLRLFDKPFQLLLVVMIVSTPLLLWLAWALSQPARKLEKAAQRVAKGEFIADPDLEKGTSEFRQAGASFNQMVLAVNQMMSSQQRLLSDISHELRSPLTRLRMANALATRKQGESNELTRIDTEAQRLEQMIAELLTLSHMQVDSHLSREKQPLSSLWEDILQDAEFEAEQMKKVLTYSAIPEQSLFGNPKLLMSALENIIRNAISYGHSTIQVQFTVNQKMLTVTVEDDGDGVPENELNDIFRPFYRVSTARDRHSGGTGLGLAITESAIRQHNGSIVASRSALGGLKMTLCLPLSD
ncbi:two-component system sensor histidine kinase CpxA [Vibrio sp. 10N.286.49.B3]|uniref:envelope stress sensor histidine kinase CpxA n=1 Tax=Vibrio sp. 10N.286.49.B3 TaxID=1880855 RepID=UPI000C81EB2C|nr:envelope stress sensor histidine kinase CpxA [Vibrio sp. 10N.286.49.B3]PMH46247.1 two-component system sensor histidine kinase CpxA [Vibrio sp. 10N.286.49.B3]